MRLGIQPQRILPGQPQQNGAHERMHKTLKRGAIHPPRATLATQQRAFDRFRAEYNDNAPTNTCGAPRPVRATARPPAPIRASSRRSRIPATA
ncbi:MAG: transposase [Gemmatimonadetes bacterium]|nr:transposase [Gemmatimonadota bacterium]